MPRRTNEIKKSVNATIIVLVGIIILGKYNLEIIFWFVMRLLEASERAFEKYCHGNMAVKTRTG